ncbi:hypothetical protein QZM52_12220 [Burkholderia metallica]|uniref:Uncharacterized protein n=1 Tax=Burkholderia metallica TaxID=488729 RepID=A0ABT8PAQ8_9BURK|nr:hypothetical protein [Burkholderia metallica]MDN7932046.1 hypothetical protein [Burkholderia metallica]
MTTKYADRNRDCDQVTRFVPWWPEVTAVRVPALSLKAAGWKKISRPVTRLSVKSYVDLDTGEIIKRRDMFIRRHHVPSNQSLRLIEQLVVLNSQLGKRARELCVFLLKMRNCRGSFVQPLEDLLRAYINRKGRVARMRRAMNRHIDLVGEIAAAGVIAQEQALGSLFQKHGKLTSREVLEEAAVFYAWPGVFQGRTGWPVTIGLR